MYRANMSVPVCNIPDFSILDVNETGTTERVLVKPELECILEEEDSSSDMTSDSTDSTDDVSSDADIEDIDDSESVHSFEDDIDLDGPVIGACSSMITESVFKQEQQHDSVEFSSYNKNCLQRFNNIPNLPADGLFGLAQSVCTETATNSSTDWKSRSFTNIPNFAVMDSNRVPQWENDDNGNREDDITCTISEEFTPNLDALTERFGNLLACDVSENAPYRENAERSCGKSFPRRRKRKVTKR